MCQNTLTVLSDVIRQFYPTWAILKKLLWLTVFQFGSSNSWSSLPKVLWIKPRNTFSIHTLNILLVISKNITILFFTYPLESDSQLPKKKFIICFNDSHSKMMKNAFYLLLKALFVLKIFKFLSWLFGHVEKTAWLER